MMPDSKDIEGLKNTSKWAIIIIYIPIGIRLLAGFLMIFIIKYDSIKSLINQ